MTEAYDNWLRSECPADIRAVLKLGKDATMADAVAHGLGRRALRGDYNAARELREAVEGRSMQRVELMGADNTITVEVEWAEAKPPRALLDTKPMQVIEAELIAAPVDAEKPAKAESSCTVDAQPAESKEESKT
jgi:hypothetical protein